MTQAHAAPNPKPIQCPKCPRTFASVRDMASHTGMHRRNAAKTSLEEAQAARKTAKAEAKAAAEGILTCPECSEKFSEPYAAQHLGRHRREKHGVISPKAAQGRAYYLRSQAKKKQEQSQLAVVPPTIQPAPKPSPKGDPHGKSSSNGNGGAVHYDAPQPGIDPVAYAICVGQILESCRNFAEKHDYPTRIFTANVARIFLDQAGG